MRHCFKIDQAQSGTHISFVLPVGVVLQVSSDVTVDSGKTAIRSEGTLMASGLGTAFSRITPLVNTAGRCSSCPASRLSQFG